MSRADWEQGGVYDGWFVACERSMVGDVVITRKMLEISLLISGSPYVRFPVETHPTKTQRFPFECCFIRSITRAYSGLRNLIPAPVPRGTGVGISVKLFPKRQMFHVKHFSPPPILEPEPEWNRPPNGDFLSRKVQQNLEYLPKFSTARLF